MAMEMETERRLGAPTEDDLEAFMAQQFAGAPVQPTPDTERTDTAAGIITALTVPFRADQISQRKIGGRQLDYVEGHAYISRLNAVCPAWSFRMTKAETIPLHVTRYDKQRAPYQTDLPCMTVYGELTIPSVGTRAGIGVQMIEDNAGEDVMKGALTDCLKNCAKYFGLGLHMYSGDAPAPAQSPTPAPARTERSQQASAPQSDRPVQQRPSSQASAQRPPMQPGTGGPATDGQKRALWAISGADKNQIDVWAAEYDESNENLTKGTASALIDAYGQGTR